MFTLRISCTLLGLCVLMCTSVGSLTPVITEFTPMNKSVETGTPVTIICKATGDPEPEIYWLKKGSQITDNNNFGIVTIPGGSALLMEAVRSRGPYTCVAENSLGGVSQVSTYLTVYRDIVPVGFPLITRHPILKAVEKDSVALMSCEAEGRPAPHISWLKDNDFLNEDDPRITILPLGHLQISSAQDSDEGEYQCIAENDLGIDFSYTAHLYVRARRVPPYFTIVPPSHTEVMVGESVMLLCSARGLPMPSVRWMLGDMPISQESIGRYLLDLSDIQRSADYTCVAASSLGEISTTVSVVVVDT